MKFRLTDETDDEWLRYVSYLDSVWSVLPRGVKAFAREEWFYNHEDHRCPHDSWLDTFVIKELSSGERKQDRQLQVTTRLLGAYHDLDLEFLFKDVTGYEVRYAGTKRPQVAHGDYLWDEVRYEGGEVVHEAIFSENSSWVIRCSDILFTWMPASTGDR